MTVVVRCAVAADLDAIKALCDMHRVELGFVMRPSLAAAIAACEVMIALDSDGSIIGVVHYHHRRDAQTTLYHLAVSASARGRGVGRMLILNLCDEARERGKMVIRLKCPEPLSANLFYACVGFKKIATEVGKSRPLCVWEMAVE